MSDKLSRRDFVGAVSVTGAVAAIAGCSESTTEGGFGIFPPSDDETDVADVLIISAGETNTIEASSSETYGGVEWEPDGELVLEPGAELTLEAV